jgi:hypothetical protein
MEDFDNGIYKVYTEQPVDSSHLALSPAVQEQLGLGGIALGTMVCMTILIREIRLLVQACGKP